MNHQKNQSRFKLLIAGIIAGLLSGVVKLGWEVMFPPRTPSRDATNPPQQHMGIRQATKKNNKKKWTIIFSIFSLS